MKLIVGLGNPGVKYKHTRHNLGFLTVDNLALNYRLRQKVFNTCSSKISKHKCFIIAKPQTYMNLSGSAVKCLVKKFKIAIEDILVVLDDVNLDLGRFKIIHGGSAYGHNGLKSIIDSLKDRNFSRLRIGVGSNPSGDLTDFVLGHLTRKEKTILDSQSEDLMSCCRDWVEKGADFTMNKYNKRKIG